MPGRIVPYNASGDIIFEKTVLGELHEGSRITSCVEGDLRTHQLEAWFGNGTTERMFRVDGINYHQGLVASTSEIVFHYNGSSYRRKITEGFDSAGWYIIKTEPFSVNPRSTSERTAYLAYPAGHAANDVALERQIWRADHPILYAPVTEIPVSSIEYDDYDLPVDPIHTTTYLPNLQENQPLVGSQINQPSSTSEISAEEMMRRRRIEMAGGAVIAGRTPVTAQPTHIASETPRSATPEELERFGVWSHHCKTRRIV